MIGAEEVVKKIVSAGEKKVTQCPGKMILKGAFAGASIATGGAFATMASTGVSDTLGSGISKLILGAVFPVGLIMILFLGFELFTGDAGVIPISAFRKKISYKKLLTLWLFVYIGNFIGSIFYAYIMATGPFVSGGEVNIYGQHAIAIAEAKVLPYKSMGISGLWQAFIKAIGCNILVNLAVLMFFASDSDIGKMVGIWFPIAAFVSSGFEHSVANMYFIPVGIFLGANITWTDFIVWNLIPVTLGNIVGGMFFVGFLYHLMTKNSCGRIGSLKNVC